MHCLSSRGLIAVSLMAAATGPAPALEAGNTRPSSVERYGLGGHIQSVGLHHGFHVETVAVDSPADLDSFRAKDVIVRVDGEEIRSMDHLRAALAEAYMDRGEVDITYLRGTSLEQHVAKGHFGPDDPRPASRERRPGPK